MKTERVTDYLLEIPKTGRMRVPGRVFVSDALMQTQKADEALKQVANVAELPGIVGYSMAMPDFHWGYGFPIGGVAAFDFEDGVISPGGVGFDVNCLGANSLCLSSLGYRRTIQEIVDQRVRETTGLIRNSRHFDSAVVTAGVAKRPTRPVMEVRTSTGRFIEATADHPFLTPDGMRPLESIGIGDRVAVWPFLGVDYEPPSGDVIVDEARIVETLRHLGKEGGNAPAQILRFLDARRLLPLTLDHPALPVLLKIAGYVLGDGSIHFDAGTGKGHVSFYGRGEDLEDVRRDAATIFRPTRLYRRMRHHRVETRYGRSEFDYEEASFRLNSSAVATLLVAMGIPHGRKPSQDWRIPPWLHAAPRWQQRLFLAAFFGAELQTPKPMKQAGKNFPCPVLGVNKHESHVESGREFLDDVRRMLSRFGVESRRIAERHEYTGKGGVRSTRLRLSIHSRLENLIRFCETVGIEYHREKRAWTNRVAAYLRLKWKRLNAKEEAADWILDERLLTGAGAPALVAAARAAGHAATPSLVRSALSGDPDLEFRVEPDFPDFEAWSATASVGDEGLVWEEVVEKVPRSDIDRVYDITVAHPEHNFIANGFVVHN